MIVKEDISVSIYTKYENEIGINEQSIFSTSNVS
jgi:hypothetical protein